MRHNHGLSQLTSQLFASVDPVVADVDPHWILAQGDTTTVFVSAMVAHYRHIAFGHVEAGLRTSNLRQPFPEEANRRIADLVADAWFAPTDTARRALLAEGCPADDVHVTGNTVIDALFDVAGRDYDWERGPLSCVPRDRPLVLVTAHRRESFGEPFRELCLAIRELAAGEHGCRARFVFPVHLNPNVRRPVQDILTGLPNVTLIEPLDYLSLVHLMKRCALILTDSGGIQEEAPSFGVPVLVMRDATERPEGLASGQVRLVGTDRRRIVAEANAVLCCPTNDSASVACANPYGDGRAAKRIVAVLLNHRRSAEALRVSAGEEAYGT